MKFIILSSLLLVSFQALSQDRVKENVRQRSEVQDEPAAPEEKAKPEVAVDGKEKKKVEVSVPVKK